MNIRLGILLFFILAPYVVNADPLNCETLFSFENSSREIELTVESLSRLQLRIDLAQVDGDRSLNLLTLGNDLNQKIRQFLSTGLLSSEELKSRMQLKIIELQEIDNRAKSKRREQNTQYRELAVDGRRILFREIQPGSFWMGEPGKQKLTQITKPFSLSATLTTQEIWGTIVVAARTRFRDRFGSLVKNPASHRGELLPVEKVPFDQVLLWIEALNALAQAGDPIVKILIPDFKLGDVFRLPTEAEWEFVARARGTANGSSNLEDHISNHDNYAWSSENSNYSSHPVATKAPLIFDDLDFYDMLGNVWEMTSDIYALELPGGVDPQSKSSDIPINANNLYYVIRGGSFANREQSVTIKIRGSERRDVGVPQIGFRLARSRP